MKRQQIEDRAIEILAATDTRLLAAYFFGSGARGTLSATSDIDIGILLNTKTEGRLQDLRFSLEGQLESALGRRVQVVDLHQAPVDLIHRVLRDGRLLLDRDRSARIRFEVQARNTYFDILPTLNRYRKRDRAQA